MRIGHLSTLGCNRGMVMDMVPMGGVGLSGRGMIMKSMDECGNRIARAFKALVGVEGGGFIEPCIKRGRE